MTKRLLFFALMVAMVVTLMVPLAAKADILNASVNWYGQSFQGEDPFYGGRNVDAFLEGSTATVQFAYLNNTGSDITARPFVQFDWGGRYYGTQTTIAANEAATLGIQFTVPSAATAGLVEHGYYISLEYRQDSGRLYTEETTVDESIFVDISVTPGWDTYTLVNHPVFPGSLRVWRSTDDLSWEELASTMYTLNLWTGEFNLNTPVAVDTYFRFNYGWYENLGQGDAVTQVFSVYHHPPSYGQVVDGSLAVYLTNQYLNTVDAQSSGWTFDPLSGEITFATAPTYNQYVFARYEFWDAIGDRYNSSDAGKTFVVYSQAQADAQNARGAVNDLWDETGYLYAFDLEGTNNNGLYFGTWDDYDALLGSATSTAVAAAEKLDDEAYDLYVAGDFAGAKTQWDASAAKLQEAITSQQTLVGGVEQSVTGLVASAGTWLDAQGAKAQAEANSVTAQADAQTKKLKAEATKAKGYGTFLILMGVFFILVGVAALVIAVSKFMAGRKGPQTT